MDIESREVVRPESLIERLVTVLCGIRLNDVPVSVVMHEKTLILDFIGVAVAGSRAPAAVLLMETMRNDVPPGMCHILGTDLRTGPADAALANGMAASALEFDDFGGADHSGAAVIPAVIAISQHRQSPLSGTAFLEAVLVGYEVARRALESVGAYRVHNNHQGWHSTATCGAIGAAAGAARALDLPPDQTASCIGLATSLAGGTWACHADGAMSKQLHAGWAAHLGTYSALLARMGFTGPTYAFEATWGGFFHTHGAGTEDGAPLVAPIKDRYLISRSGVKPYPICRDAHAAIDAALQLRADHRVRAADVETVRVLCSAAVLQLVGRRAPATAAAAAFSLSYCLAVAFVHGRVSLDQLARVGVDDAEVRAFEQRVQLEWDPNADVGDEEPVVIAQLRDGRNFRCQVPFGRGDERNPMAVTEVLAKFHDLTEGLLTREQQRTLVERIMDFEGTHDAGSIFDIT